MGDAKKGPGYQVQLVKLLGSFCRYIDIRTGVVHLVVYVIRNIMSIHPNSLGE